MSVRSEQKSSNSRAGGIWAPADSALQRLILPRWPSVSYFLSSNLPERIQCCGDAAFIEGVRLAQSTVATQQERAQDGLHARVLLDWFLVTRLAGGAFKAQQNQTIQRAIGKYVCMDVCTYVHTYVLINACKSVCR